MKQNSFIVWLALLLFAGLCGASPHADFEAGLAAYRSNDMTAAVTAWERVVQQGIASGPLYYNLGNAYYRSNRVGLAILNYERARKLMPRDRDVSGNLDLAHLAVVDKIEPPVRLFIWNWIDRVRDYLTLTELAWMFHLLGVLAGTIFLLWRYGPLKVRGLLKGGLVTVFVLYVVCGSWYVWRVSVDAKMSAIVTAAKTDIYSAPDAASKQLFSLHEGTKIVCGEQLAGWTNILLSDGRKGWVQIGDIEKI
jgi:tetratricopeptide (TPR) repeat protein